MLTNDSNATALLRSFARHTQRVVISLPVGTTAQVETYDETGRLVQQTHPRRPTTWSSGSPRAGSPWCAARDATRTQCSKSPAVGTRTPVRQMFSSRTISLSVVRASLSARFRAEACWPWWSKVTSTDSNPLCRWAVAASV